VALQAAGGDSPLLVVSANPGCAMHRAAAGVDVRHPAQLVEAALTGTRAPNGRATADG
jgi:hypothetical protein